MSNAPPAIGASARPRRLLSWVWLGVLVASAIASVFFANVIGAETATRLDVTATGEHRLSPRTLATLASLRGEHRLVLAAPARDVSPVARREVEDVLAEMEHAAPNFRAAWIDTSGAGVDQLRTLAAELVARERALIDDQAKRLDLAAAAAELAGSTLESAVSQGLLSVKLAIGGTDQKADTNRKFFDERAAIARVLGEDLKQAAARTRRALAPDATALGVPATDRARESLLAATGPTLTRLDDLARELSGAVRTNALGDNASEPLRKVADTVSRLRDALASGVDPAQQMRRPDVLRISEALKAEKAVLAIGPPGSPLLALDFDEMVPTAEAVQAGGRGASGFARADLRRRAENTAATVLAALSTPLRPIVVLTHAEPRPFLDQVPLFEKLVRRLEQRGCDVVEWCAVQSADPPKLATTTPAGERPVVYVSLAPDSSTSAPGEQAGSKRAGVLGQALARAAANGGALLVSMNPSVLPTFGEKDPTVDVLGLFGLEAATGRPILDELGTARARAVNTDAVLQARDQDHPIAKAVRGLPTFFGWPVQVREVEDTRRATPGQAAKVTFLYTIESPTAWAESQWLGYWQTPGDQRRLLPDPPRFDEGRDSRGPWTIAAAAERTMPGGLRQRLVAVGSNNWFTDFVSQRQGVIDGRAVSLNPGNAELFEASILWLAGQDALIGQSPESRSIPVVQPLTPRQLTLLRLGVILGLPGLVLLLGLAHRLVFG